MNDVKMLERKVDLLIDYITCHSDDFKRKSDILLELKNLKHKTALPRAKSVKLVTEDLLTKLGVPTKLQGYAYTVTALEFIHENPALRVGIVQNLYPMVAKAHSTTPSRVERAIRHAIEVVCERGDMDALYDFFGNTMSTFKGKPTNSEFISRFYQLVEREMEMP